MASEQERISAEQPRPKRRPWTKEDEQEALRLSAKGERLEIIAWALGRTPSAVRAKLSRLRAGGSQLDTDWTDCHHAVPSVALPRLVPALGQWAKATGRAPGVELRSPFAGLDWPQVALHSSIFRVEMPSIKIPDFGKPFADEAKRIGALAARMAGAYEGPAIQIQDMVREWSDRNAKAFAKLTEPLNHLLAEYARSWEQIAELAKGASWTTLGGVGAADVLRALGRTYDDMLRSDLPLSALLTVIDSGRDLLAWALVAVDLFSDKLDEGSLSETVDLLRHETAECEETVKRVVPRYLHMYQGANKVLREHDYPDWERHVLSSVRALLWWVLHDFAPEDQVVRWASSHRLSGLTNEKGRPTHGAKCQYILRDWPSASQKHLGEVGSSFAKLLKHCSDGLHSAPPKLSERQLEYLSLLLDSHVMLVLRAIESAT